MQNSLQEDVVLNRVLFAHGIQTPASDYDCQPSESLQTVFNTQAFYQYQASKHLPPSPASTVSDRSDHSETFSTSDVSSQSSQSSQSDHSGSRDSSPLAIPAVQDGHRNVGVNCGGTRRSRPVTSCHTTEVHPITSHQPVCGRFGSTLTQLQNNNINSSSNGKYNDTKLGGKPSIYTAPTSAASHNETTLLPYRSRCNNTLESSTPTGDRHSVLEGMRVQAKEETTSSKVEPSCRDGSSGGATSRCFVGMLNPFATSATSSENTQTNPRRRPMGSTLPPPKLRRDTDNTDAIVKMIVIFCTNLIQSIWPIDSASGPASCNTASQSAGNVLPLQVFITETLRRSKTSYSTLQIALFYLILLRQCLPELTQPGQRGQSGCRAMLCGRRMFLTALILASKYLQDRNYSARAWSKISGLPMKEINDNERRYLRFVGWDLHVPKEAFENWSKIVLAICRLSTGQDPAAKDFDHPPPGPGSGPTSQTNRRSQLQDMCSMEQVHVVRSWWIFNLHGLCTDVVRCPQKTDRYVSSIPQLKTVPALTRPLFEKASIAESFDNIREQEDQPTVHKISRPPSMEFVDKTPMPVRSDLPSMASKTMPPPPPVLGFLPTPQTTPRFDVSNISRTSQSRSSSRCRDSASLLRNVDRGCPSASMEKFPVPKSALPLPGSLYLAAGSQDCKSFLSQPSPSALSASSCRARQFFQMSDRSLTSSPESVISDISSFSGFVGRSRTSSFSSTSSRSTLSQSHTMTSDPERCEGFKRQLNSLDAQIAPRVHDWTNTTSQTEFDRQISQAPSRPQTAFRTSILRPGCFEIPKVSSGNTDTESVLDEGYCSGDHAQIKREDRRKLASAPVPAHMQVQQQLVQAMSAFRNRNDSGSTPSRPALMRSNTQVYMSSRQPSGPSQQTLKRCRSESFDMSTEPCLPEMSSCKTSFLSKKDIQESWQPWAASKQPIQCIAQDMNKRIAVQSPAVTRANTSLRKEACEWFNHHNQTHTATREPKVNSLFAHGSLWQQCVAPLQEIQI